NAPTPSAGTLDRFAQLLNLVAEQKDDDYLRAVGASYGDLAGRLRTHDVPLDEIALVLEELAHHTLAASLGAGDEFSAAVQAALSERPSLPTQQVQAPESVPLGTGQANLRGEAVQDAISSYFQALDSLVSQFERDPRSMGVQPEQDEMPQTLVADLYHGE